MGVKKVNSMVNGLSRKTLPYKLVLMIYFRLHGYIVLPKVE